MRNSPGAAPALRTVGYERAGFANFLACLQQAGVGRMIDIRDLPLSRRAGFSKRALAAGLAAGGIDYVHLRALGTPVAGREANRRRQWPVFWSIVEARLQTGEAEDALERAAMLAAERPSCLLCFEADPCICHRLRVGEMLAERHGFRVEHLRVGAALD